MNIENFYVPCESHYPWLYDKRTFTISAAEMQGELNVNECAENVATANGGGERFSGTFPSEPRCIGVTEKESVGVKV